MKAITLMALCALTTVCSSQSLTEVEYPAASPEIRYSGRHTVSDGYVSLAYPGIEIEIAFTGSAIAIEGEILGGSSHYNVYLNGEAYPQLNLSSGQFTQPIIEGLPADAEHRLRLVRRSESWIGVTRLDSIRLSEDGKLVEANSSSARKMICIGDSITCGEKADLLGYVENGPLAWNAEKSYAKYLGKAFDAETHLVSYGGRGLIRDWQGKTDPATAPRFFEYALPDSPERKWDHDLFQPDLVTICLGTNDFNQGIPEREDFVSAYVAFVQRIHEVHPHASVLLISGPWFEDGDPKKAALNAYILETIETVNAGGAPFAHHHFFDTTYPGTQRDAHPIAPQHKAMAEDIGETIEAWLDW